jgi:hypothetical protein
MADAAQGELSLSLPPSAPVDPADACGAERGGPVGVMVPLKRRNVAKIRRWPHKKKVSSNISKEFPWEVIVSYLKNSVSGIQALVRLQMVDKNLRQVLRSNRSLWRDIFKTHVYMRQMTLLVGVVKDWRYPLLHLHYSPKHSVPVHAGLIPGDDFYSDTDERNEQFCNYVRKAVALKFGKRCGMCGARHRHDIVWGLGMRVCKLCVAANSISAVSLFYDYGIHFMDFIRNHYSNVFYFELNTHENGNILSYYDMPGFKDSGLLSNYKGTMKMVWLPHLRQCMNLQETRESHAERKHAAQYLTSLVRRRYLLNFRERMARRKRPSIDGILIFLNMNEKKRLIHPYGKYSSANECWERNVLGSRYAFVTSWSFRCRIMKKHGCHPDWIDDRINEWARRVPYLVK